MMKLFSGLMVLAMLARSDSFGVSDVETSRMTMTRSNFFSAMVAATGAVVTAGSTPAPVWADDAALKGTKKDPDFESCLGLCLYECTKAKGVEQKSRKECLPECKSSCAKTKAQTMLGTPVSN